jgi:hypothetical protein
MPAEQGKSATIGHWRRPAHRHAKEGSHGRPHDLPQEAGTGASILTIDAIEREPGRGIA